jgi:hypothetical protein
MFVETMMKSGTKWLLALAGGAAALYALAIRPWHLRWGATAQELAMTLPCDDLVPEAKLDATHAIAIDASVSKVWPWLAQMGQTRGGFYSYAWLENLVGCRIRNADRIHLEWQDLKVGDEVWLHPKAPPLRVLAMERQKYIALEKCWTFYVQPLGENRTRLIIRGRGDYYPDFKNALLNFIYFRLIFELAHFIMERKMMLGIKERAEAFNADEGDGPR